MERPSIDVIIPVYRGLAEARACIESVLSARVTAQYGVVVVNDASPERELAEYLSRLAGGGEIHLLENDHNRGFAATANRGMELHRNNDVVLLNSDTEVANDWLDRLLAVADRDPRIGTVTPFSNNASICSYPRMLAANPLPSGWTVAEMDRLFAAANTGKSPELPVGVGFCLFIRRQCLVEVGAFDTANFALGYGEENEFCMRARRHGWRHVLAADTFVYHKGAVSFGDSAPLQSAATQRLHELHPEYARLAGHFILQDPLRVLRNAVDHLRALVSHEDALRVLDERTAFEDALQGDRTDGAQRIEELETALAARTEDLESSASELRRSANEISLLQGQLQAALAERDAYAGQLAELGPEITRLRSRIGELEKAFTRAEELLGERTRECTALDEALAGERTVSEKLRRDMQALQQDIDGLAGELKLVYASRSWRYTAPLRRLLGAR